MALYLFDKTVPKFLIVLWPIQRSHISCQRVHSSTSVSQHTGSWEYTLLEPEKSTIPGRNQKQSRGMANLKGWVFLFITSPLLVFANYNLDNKEFSFFHDGNLDPDSPAVSGNILDNGDFESGDGSLGDWSCTNCHCSVEQFQAPLK